MKQSLLKLRVFTLATAGVTLAVAILRTVPLFVAFDREIGYFASGSAPVTILYILEGLALLAAFVLPFLVKRDTLPVTRTPLTRAAVVSAGLAALASLAAIVLIFVHLASLSEPALAIVPISVLGAIFLIITAAFFILQFLAEAPPPHTLALCGYGVILAAVCLLSLTYFDLTVQMNAPHKISLHLALLSIMFCMLFDVRTLLGIARPRAHGVVSAICCFLCITTGLSNCIAFIGDIYTDLLSLGADLFVLIFGIFTGIRLAETAWQKQE